MERKLALLFFSLIILAAGFFRLSHLGFMEYKADERYAFLMVKELIELQKFPLSGLGASVGVRNPPLFIYLISFPALVKSSPIFITGFIACLNILAVILTFFFARKFLGTFEAVASSGFFSLSTWSIVYSRKLWAQNCLPFFTILLLFFLAKALKNKGRKIHFFLIGFLAVILFQIHYSGLIVFPCLFLFYFLSKKKFKLKSVFLGFLTGLIFFIPFLILQFQTNFKDFEKIIKLIFNFGFSDRKFQLIYPFYSFILSGGLKTFEFLGFDYLLFLNSLPKFVHLGVYAVFTAEIILIFLGLFFSILQSKKDVVYLLILIWFSLPTLILSLIKIGDRPFYYLITFPSQFILIAIALKQIRKIKPLKYLSYFGLASAFFLIFVFNLYLGKYIIQKKVIRGEYGWVYRDKVSFINDLEKSLNIISDDVNTSNHIKGHNSWEVRYLLSRSLEYPKNKVQLEIALKENPGFDQARSLLEKLEKIGFE